VICFVCGDDAAEGDTALWISNVTWQRTVCVACRPFWEVALPLVTWRRDGLLGCSLCDRPDVTHELYYRIRDRTLVNYGTECIVCPTCLFVKLRVLVAKTALDARKHAEAA
jgi:hypothetical protein